MSNHRSDQRPPQLPSNAESDRQAGQRRDEDKPLRMDGREDHAGDQRRKRDGDRRRPAAHRTTEVRQEDASKHRLFDDWRGHAGENVKLDDRPCARADGGLLRRMRGRRRLTSHLLDQNREP